MKKLLFTFAFNFIAPLHNGRTLGERQLTSVTEKAVVDMGRV